MAAACEAAGIEFIPGTELTAEHNDTEIHLLGYFVDTQNEKLLSDIAQFQAVRQNRIREMVARAQRIGRAADGRNCFCAGQLQVTRTPARRPRAGEGRTGRESGRSLRAFSEKEPAGVGAQGQNVRARSH